MLTFLAIILALMSLGTFFMGGFIFMCAWAWRENYAVHISVCAAIGSGLLWAAYKCVVA